MRRVFQPLFVLLVLVAIAASASATPSFAPDARDWNAVSTFHSIGLYWAPAGGGSGVPARVRFRPAGTTAWRGGLDLWFDTRNGEYRGSIVELQPGTAYEIELTLGSNAPRIIPGPGEAPERTRSTVTWAEVYPVKQVVQVTSRTTTLNITQGGSAAEGYVVYEGVAGNNTITLPEGSGACVRVDAKFVVVRNLVMVGCGTYGVELWSEHFGGTGNPRRAASDVWIEDNEIRGWGRRRATVALAVDEEGAIKCNNFHETANGNDDNNRTHRIVVQRNRIHSPRYSANDWSTGHPRGAQAVFFNRCGRNHVIRYNEIYSTNGNFFNDGIGGAENLGDDGGSGGFPWADSDIYGNAISHAYDDGIEAEGDNRNVRVWSNYLDKVGIVMGNAATAKGPLYVWRNVSNQLANIKCPSCTETSEDRGPFIKGGSNAGAYNGGIGYYFHNTVLQPPGVNFPRGAGFGIGDPGGVLFNFVSRNNIWHIHRITDNPGEPDFFSIIADCSATQPCSADFDLFNGRLLNAGSNAESGAIANGWGAAGGSVGAVPTYATSGTSYPAANAIPAQANNWTGDLRLAPGSRGTSGVPLLPNFNDLDPARHVGAHPPGTPAMKFGRAAAAPPPVGPMAQFTASQLPTPPRTVAFDASSSKAGSSPITAYGIDFGDKTSGSGAQQTHTYSAAGTYTATLTVTDANNLSGSASQTITVTDGPSPGQAFELDFSIQPGAIAVQGVTFDATVAASEATRTLVSVRFFLDGTLMATDTTSPYQFSWTSPATGALGNHTITAEATDTLGNVVTKARTVTLQSQTCNAIAGASTVQQGAAVSIQGVCSTGTTVLQMELYVDNVLRTADVGAPFTWTLDTSSLAVGMHTIMVRALLSPSGEASHSVSLEVTAAPLALTFRPGPIVMRSDRMTINATATDGRALKQVDFYIDGVFRRGETQSPFELQWDTTAADRYGRHTLVVQATDAAGNTLSATRDLYLTTRTCNVLVGTASYLVGSHDTAYVGPHTIPRGQRVAVQGVCAVPLQRMEFYLDGATTPASIDSAGPTYNWTLDTTGFVNGEHTIAIKGVISPTAESNHSIKFEIVDP